MELRGNIIFSILVHGSIAITALVFAGRNATLSHLPENYIAVSLLEDRNEKKSVAGNKPAGKDQDTSKKRDMKSQEAPSSDNDEGVVTRNERVTSQYPKSNPSGEERDLRETRNPDTKSEMTSPGVQEQPVALRGRQAGSGEGSGDTHTIASSSAAVSGSSLEVTMMGPHPAGSGTDSRSVFDRIRAAIEKAKIYPIIARKRGQEGIVLAEFSINGKGQPEGIKIVKSSGSHLLDAAAKDTVIRAAPFPVVRGNIEVPIRFTLK